MKRFVLILNLLFAFAGFTFAQTPPASSAKKPATTKTATTAPANAPGPKKKDGTPDMRYKANKDAAKTQTVHLKKDGTPDKRYKENKPAKQ